MSNSAMTFLAVFLLGSNLIVPASAAGEFPKPPEAFGTFLGELWQICDDGMDDLAAADQLARTSGWKNISPDPETDFELGILNLQKEFNVTPTETNGNLDKAFGWITLTKQKFHHASYGSCVLGSGSEALDPSTIADIDRLADSSEGLVGSAIVPTVAGQQGRWSHAADDGTVTLISVVHSPSSMTLLFQRITKSSESSQ